MATGNPPLIVDFSMNTSIYSRFPVARGYLIDCCTSPMLEFDVVLGTRRVLWRHRGVSKGGFAMPGSSV